MTDEEWPLTSRAIADSERAAHGEYDLTDDEPEPERGNRLLHDLVARSNGKIVQLSPGVFYARKVQP